MSTASKVGQVIFSQKSGVYMPAIMCDKGDLYQMPPAPPPSRRTSPH